MKFRTFLSFIRLPWTLFVVGVAVGFSAMAVFGDIYGWFSRTPEHAFALVIIPWWLGTTLNRISLAHLHRPAAMTLPHLARLVLLTHGCLTFFAALFFAVVATRGELSLPLPVAALEAWFFLNLPVLSARPMVWWGSRFLGYSMPPLVFLAAYVDNSWMPVLYAHPVISGAVLLALTGGLYRKLLSGDQLRLRINSPNLTLLAADQRRRELQRQIDLKRNRPQGRWHRRLIPPTTREHNRLLSFEHHRGRGSSFHLISLAASFGTVLTVMACIVLFDRPNDGFVFLQGLSEATAAFLWGLPHELAPAYMGGILLVIYSSLMAHFLPQLVRPANYPLSRRQLAMAVLRLNTQHVLIWHGSFVAMIVVFAAGTHLLGLHTPELARLPPALGGLMLSMTISWLVLTSRMFTTTWKHLFEKIFLLASTTLLMLVPAAGVLFHESVLSPTGLVVSCAINLILWMGYAGALHRHYRSKDLNAHQVGLDYQVT